MQFAYERKEKLRNSAGTIYDMVLICSIFLELLFSKSRTPWFSMPMFFRGIKWEIQNAYPQKAGALPGCPHSDK